MPDPRVSVIVPVFNVEKFLPECVSSILQQTHDSLEVLLVDDGSTDSSARIADEFGRKDDRVRVLHLANGGVSRARNAGIAEACGDWLTFVDADDWLAADFVESMLETALGHGVRMVVSAKLLERDGDSARSGRSWVLDGPRATQALLYPGIAVGCWAKLFHTETIRSNEILFDDRLSMGEGLDFITAVSQHEAQVAFTSYPAYFYRRDNSESVTSRLSPARMQNAQEALDRVEARLSVEDEGLQLALKYHRWRTRFLELAARLDAGESWRGPGARRATKELRATGWRMVLFARVSPAERLRAVAIAVAPRLTAGRLVARWRRARVS